MERETNVNSSTYNYYQQQFNRHDFDDNFDHLNSLPQN